MAGGMEDQISGVGHDGGAARGDAVCGLKKQEAGEEIVDGDSGLEFGALDTSRGSSSGALIASALKREIRIPAQAGSRGIRSGWRYLYIGGRRCRSCWCRSHRR